MRTEPLTQEEVRRLFHYDPDTGVFTALVSRGSRTVAGSVVGTANPKHLYVRLKGKKVYLHRLAWLYVHGVSPHQVDHIDRNGLNNALVNLRACTQSQNLANRGRNKNNTTGRKGVSFDKRRRKFEAYITVNYKRSHLGYFDTSEAAHVAYKAAAEQNFGDFARTA